MIANELLKQVKDNLIITFNDDDSLIQNFIAAAITYAEEYQHKDSGYYESNEMSETTKHQGIMALIPQTEYASVEDILELAQEKNEAPFIFILDEIEDPHNLGAIIRTANVCGAHGVIIPKRRSATVNGTVAKASAGAVSSTLIARVNNISNTIAELKKKNVWVYGMEADGDRMYYEHDLTGSIAIVVGSEGFGMSQLVRKSCDFTVKIPVKGTVNSLNASVATGVVAFEALRQRLLK